MKGSLSESTLWATELAARLRFLQSSLLHDVPETRERVLNKEISRALKPLALPKQKQCLEVLAAQFPVPDPFTVRRELEEKLRIILAEKDAAVSALAEKEAALKDMQGNTEDYRKLYEEFQKSQKDLDKAKQDLQKLQERLTETRDQYNGQFVVLKKERDAALRQRDDLAPARERDVAQMARMAEELRQYREGAEGPQPDLAQAREQALAEMEVMRAKYEAQLAALKKERDAAVRQRDEEAAWGGSLREDPQTLVDGLLKVLPKATEAQVSALVSGLQNGGWIPAGDPTSVKIPKELIERLRKISMTRSVDATRGLRALEILINFAVNVDQLVWQVWKIMAPKSVIHVDAGRYGDVRKSLAPYITGDPDVNAEQVKQAVEKTRKLVAGLLTSMGTVGETYAGILREHLSPATIKKLVDGEGGGIFDIAEKRYWKKYNDLFPKLNGPALEKDAFNSIRRYTEKLVLGGEAPSLENE